MACTIFLILLSHVFPIAAGHVAELLFLDADGFEVGAPEVLEHLVVGTQHIGIELAIGQVEWHGGLVLEGDVRDRIAVVIIAIVALGIIDEPGLVVEAVLKVVGDERQHVMVGRDNGEIGAILGFLESYELLHAQLLV